MTRTVGVLVAVLLTLAGCSSQQDSGRVVGAVAGAAVGSQVGGGSGRTAAMVAGTLLGGWIGGRVGARMDREDEQRAMRALEDNGTRETESWTNPDTGAEWAVTPTRTFDEDGRPCREFETVVRTEDGDQRVEGVACRRSDGEWEVVES